MEVPFSLHLSNTTVKRAASDRPLSFSGIAEGLSVVVSCYTVGWAYRQDVQHQQREGDIMKDLESHIHESEMNAIPDNQVICLVSQR